MAVCVKYKHHRLIDSVALSIMAVIYLLRLFSRRFSRSKPYSQFLASISYYFRRASSYYFSRSACALSLICLYRRSFLAFRSALCFKISSILPLISFIRSSTSPTSFFSPQASSTIFLRAAAFSLWARCISSTMPMKTSLRWPTRVFSSSMRVLQKWWIFFSLQCSCTTRSTSTAEDDCLPRLT